MKLSHSLWAVTGSSFRALQDAWETLKLGWNSWSWVFGREGCGPANQPTNLRSTPLCRCKRIFLLLTNHPMVTCGTLPAPVDLLLDWRSEHVGHECPPNLLHRDPSAELQAPNATAGTCVCPPRNGAGDELCSCPSSVPLRGHLWHAGKIWEFA